LSVYQLHYQLLRQNIFMTVCSPSTFYPQYTT
jgi:hypothetical protein